MISILHLMWCASLRHFGDAVASRPSMCLVILVVGHGRENPAAEG
jgi:hypothetical protein